MNKLVMAVLVVTAIMATGITGVNAQGGFNGVNTPKTNISNIKQMVGVIDEYVEMYLGDKLYLGDKMTSDELTRSVESAVASSSKQSGVKVESVFKKLEEIYTQRKKDAIEEIAKCKEKKERCFEERHNQLNAHTALLAIINARYLYYIGDTKKMVQEIEEEDSVGSNLDKVADSQANQSNDSHYWRNKLKERLAKEKEKQ